MLPIIYIKDMHKPQHIYMWCRHALIARQSYTLMLAARDNNGKYYLLDGFDIMLVHGKSLVTSKHAYEQVCHGKTCASSMSYSQTLSPDTDIVVSHNNVNAPESWCNARDLRTNKSMHRAWCT